MSFESYAAHLRRQWRGRGRALVVLEEVDSTHLLSRRIAHEYSKEGSDPVPLDLIAWRQSSGVGRGTNHWVSPAGEGLYISQVCPRVDKSGLQYLPLRVALALCEVLDSHLSEPRCRLKWPNDLMLDGRKTGGILIDVLPGEGGPACVVSYGINVFEGQVADEASGATTLARETSNLDMGKLASECLSAVDAAVNLPADVAEVAAEIRSRSLHRHGDDLRFRSGGEEIRGTFLGLDDRGFLLLEVDGEERRMASGEVVIQESPMDSSDGGEGDDDGG